MLCRQCNERQTLKENFSRPSENPGNGWYRVPAFATTARCVVGPGRSLLANFTPPTSPVSYEKLPDAADARQRLLLHLVRHWRARCPLRAKAALGIILAGKQQRKRGPQLSMIAKKQLEISSSTCRWQSHRCRPIYLAGGTLTLSADVPDLNFHLFTRNFDRAAHLQQLILP